MMFQNTDAYDYKRRALREWLLARIWQDERALGWTPAERVEIWTGYYESQMRTLFGEVQR